LSEVQQNKANVSNAANLLCTIYVVNLMALGQGAVTCTCTVHVVKLAGASAECVLRNTINFKSASGNASVSQGPDDQA